MGKAFLLLLGAALVAVFFVPFRGSTLWESGQRRGVAYAAVHAARAALGWFSDPARKAPTAPPARAPAAQARRAPEAGADRIVKAPPKERLSPDDRASLDRLVTNRSR